MVGLSGYEVGGSDAAWIESHVCDVGGYVLHTYVEQALALSELTYVEMEPRLARGPAREALEGIAKSERERERLPEIRHVERFGRPGLEAVERRARTRHRDRVGRKAGVG